MEEENILLKSLDEKANECIVKNRRKGPDFLMNLLNIFNYSTWAILLVIFAISENAGVKFFVSDNVFLEDMNLEFVNIAIKFAAVLFILSFILILLSLKRCRRRDDKIKTSIFIGEIVSFAVWMYFVFKLYF